MISENDKNEMCRMRRLGFTLDYIAKATGYSASSVANATACVERPLASSGKDKQIEAMIHKACAVSASRLRYAPRKASVRILSMANEQGGPRCLRNLLSGGTEVTFKEYKKLWALPADIKARESRIEKLLRRKEAIAQDAVHGSAENFPYTKHTVIIRGVETDADVLAMQERLKKLNDEYDRLYGRALIEIEDITDPEVRVAISRRSFDGWSWAEVAQELGRSEDAVKKCVGRYFS